MSPWAKFKRIIRMKQLEGNNWQEITGRKYSEENNWIPLEGNNWISLQGNNWKGIMGGEMVGKLKSTPLKLTPNLQKSL